MIRVDFIIDEITTFEYFNIRYWDIESAKKYILAEYPDCAIISAYRVPDDVVRY
jgi:hypothetical protein